MRLVVTGLVCGLATAAPVPKTKPTMEEVYGTVRENFESCTAATDKSGRLVVTKPATGQGCHPNDVASIGPVVAKEVEGDFTLTTRMTLNVPTAVTSTDGNRRGQAGAAAGICVHDGAERNEQCVGVAVGSLDVNKGKPNWFEDHWGAAKGAGSGGVNGYEHGQPIWLRAIRKENDVTEGWSTDGKKWESERTYVVKGRVRVGVVTYGCLSEDFTATFDEYELKVVEK